MTNMASVSIALLTTRAPSPLADELMLAGFKVTEALWADEVLQLLETEDIDVVVITPDFNESDPELPEVKARLTTLKLHPTATVKSVVWELSHVFPSFTSKVN
jgi:hypothetical protein